MNSYDENNQIIIARQLAEDLKEGDKEKAQTIVSLLYESAIDKTTQGTISVIKNEIKEWLGNGSVSFEVGTYPNIKQCRRKLQG